jgi:hypothetical protein
MHLLHNRRSHKSPLSRCRHQAERIITSTVSYIFHFHFDGVGFGGRKRLLSRFFSIIRGASYGEVADGVP